MSTITLTPIGTVHSTRTQIADDLWDHEQSFIELGEDFSVEALFGIDSFSHVEVIFYMDQVKPEKIVRTARHPRNRQDWPKIGIFAQRGKNRPNQLGLTICQVERVEGKRLYLRGLDAIDGTPVLDIKPWVQEFGPRGSHKQPTWISTLMERYWDTTD